MTKTRKDVLDDFDTVAAILDRAEMITLALSSADGPYSLPMNFAREGRSLLLHSSGKTRKIELIAADSRVGFSCAIDLELVRGDAGCEFSYRFRSVMGRGVARLVDDVDEKRRGLDLIVRKYAGKSLPLDDRVLEKTALIAIDIQAATARLKRYDGAE